MHLIFILLQFVPQVMEPGQTVSDLRTSQLMLSGTLAGLFQISICYPLDLIRMRIALASEFKAEFSGESRFLFLTFLHYVRASQAACVRYGRLSRSDCTNGRPLGPVQGLLADVRLGHALRKARRLSPVFLLLITFVNTFGKPKRLGCDANDVLRAFTTKGSQQSSLEALRG